MKNKDEYSASSRNSKPWLRTTLKRRSRPFDQIMAENSDQMNSKSYAKTWGLRGSYPLHIIHNRMGLQKGRIERSWKLQEKCFMIKIFPCIMGRSFQNSGVCTELYSTQSTWEQDTWRSLFRQETKSHPSQNIQLSSVHTNYKKKRTMLDPPRKKGILVGYFEISKAYRI